MSPHKDNTGLKRVYNAFFYSMNGFKACFKTEEAFQQEVVLALVMLPASFFVGQTMLEQIILISVIIFVLVVELLNTGIERAIDRISFDKHDLSKEAKDMGSAAVLLSLALAGFIWGYHLYTNFIV